MVREEGEAAVYCPNVACPGRQLEGLVHFTSRGAMDIRGLSYARIQQLVEEGLVHDPADMYSLTPDKLLKLDGYAAKGASGLVEAIAQSKSQPLSAAAARARHQTRRSDRGSAPSLRISELSRS